MRDNVKMLCVTWHCVCYEFHNFPTCCNGSVPLVRVNHYSRIGSEVSFCKCCRLLLKAA